MNNLLENIRIALGALVSNKLRAALTTLGIGIGIGAVIILISLGNAAQGYINRQFQGTGANIVTINSSNSGGFGGRGDVRTVKLGMNDLAALQNPNNVSGIVNAVPVLGVRGATQFGVNTSETQISGTSPEYFPVQN